jgi:hypothetical protein
MAVRIRVYPQNGMYGGLGGYGMRGMYGGYGQLAQVQLRNEKKTSALRLQYERALWQEKLKTVQLQTAMQYGAGGYAVNPWSAYGMNSALGGFGALGLGGLGMGLGGTNLFGSLGLGGLFG